MFLNYFLYTWFMIPRERVEEKSKNKKYLMNYNLFLCQRMLITKIQSHPGIRKQLICFMLFWIYLVQMCMYKET